MATGSRPPSRLFQFPEQLRRLRRLTSDSQARRGGIVDYVPVSDSNSTMPWCASAGQDTNRDHIHIELDWAGARKKTSFWRNPLAG